MLTWSGKADQERQHILPANSDPAALLFPESQESKERASHISGPPRGKIPKSCLEGRYTYHHWASRAWCSRPQVPGESKSTVHSLSCGSYSRSSQALSGCNPGQQKPARVTNARLGPLLLCDGSCLTPALEDSVNSINLQSPPRALDPTVSGSPPPSNSCLHE